MYCPGCFNNSLLLKRSGVVNVIVNGKQMDAGRFLFHFDGEGPEGHEKFMHNLEVKIEEFFRWYQNFKNKESIKTIHLWTNDVQCENRCKLPLDQKFSLIDVVVTFSELNEIIQRLAPRYGMQIELVHQIAS